MKDIMFIVESLLFHLTCIYEQWCSSPILGLVEMRNACACTGSNNACGQAASFRAASPAMSCPLLQIWKALQQAFGEASETDRERLPSELRRLLATAP